MEIGMKVSLGIRASKKPDGSFREVIQRVKEEDTNEKLHNAFCISNLKS